MKEEKINGPNVLFVQAATSSICLLIIIFLIYLLIRMHYSERGVIFIVFGIAVLFLFIRYSLSRSDLYIVGSNIKIEKLLKTQIIPISKIKTIAKDFYHWFIILSLMMVKKSILGHE